MTRRRQVVRTVGLGTVAVLGGCQGAPLIGGCQRPAEDPPSTDFALEFATREEETLWYELRYQGDATFDRSNTGILEFVWRFRAASEQQVVGTWFDVPASTPPGQSSPTYEPVEPGDTRKLSTSESDVWLEFTLYWGPPDVPDRPDSCELAVVERWPERPPAGNSS